MNTACNTSTALTPTPAYVPWEKVLEPHQVAHRLKVSVRTVHRMVERGELRGAHVGKQLRILESDFREYWERIFGPGGPFDPVVYRRRG